MPAGPALTLRFATRAATLDVAVVVRRLTVAVAGVYVDIAAARATTENLIEVAGQTSIAPAHAVLKWGGALWLGVAGDHCQQDEADPLRTRMLCAAPLAPEFWRLDEVLEHWDRLLPTGPSPRDVMGGYVGRGRAFEDAFAARFGVRPSPLAAYAYDAATALLEASARAAGPDGFRDRLQRTAVAGVTGPVAFDEHGGGEPPERHVAPERLGQAELPAHGAVGRREGGEVALRAQNVDGVAVDRRRRRRRRVR